MLSLSYILDTRYTVTKDHEQLHSILKLHSRYRNKHLLATIEVGEIDQPALLCRQALSAKNNLYQRTEQEGSRSSYSFKPFG